MDAALDLIHPAPQPVHFPVRVAATGAPAASAPCSPAAAVTASSSSIPGRRPSLRRQSTRRPPLPNTITQTTCWRAALVGDNFDDITIIAGCWLVVSLGLGIIAAARGAGPGYPPRRRRVLGVSL